MAAMEACLVARGVRSKKAGRNLRACATVAKTVRYSSLLPSWADSMIRKARAGDMNPNNSCDVSIEITALD
jgi:hypothetical protein